MSRQFRYRMAALVASGLIFGVPLLTNGTASADQLEPSGRRVTFDGGVLGLSCGSKPNVERMTVPAESTLHVVNRTGHDARLALAGKPKGVIPENGTAEVLFRRGTTPVLLTPDCSGSDDPVPMLVTAVPSASASQADPEPDDFDASTLPSPADDAFSSALPGTRSPRVRPVRPDHGRSRDHDDRRAASAGSADDSHPGKKDKDQVKDAISRTAEARDPALAGMPPGGRRTQLPADRPATAVTGDDVVQSASAAPVVPLGSRTDPDDSAPGDLAQLDQPMAAPAAEPVAAVGPLRTGQPIGLLGMTAVVCALGVLTAAIRAIVSQRASRSNLA